LLQEITQAPVIDLISKPGRGRKEPGQIGFISTVHDTPSNVRHTLVGQDHQSGQIVLKMLDLTTVLEQIMESRRMSKHQWRRSDNWKLHQLFTQMCKMTPKVSRLG
jgi:hypothetical protein